MTSAFGRSIRGEKWFSAFAGYSFWGQAPPAACEGSECARLGDGKSNDTGIARREDIEKGRTIRLDIIEEPFMVQPRRQVDACMSRMITALIASGASRFSDAERISNVTA